MIRVVLPYHLRNLAKVTGEVQVDVPAPVTITRILDVLESRYPSLAGTIRDHGTLKRRPLVRFYVCEEDLTFDDYDKPLPDAIVSGKEPFFVIGAIAGG